MKKIKLFRNKQTYTICYTDKVMLNVPFAKITKMILKMEIVSNKKLRMIKNEQTGYESFWFNGLPVDEDSKEYPKLKEHIKLADKVYKLSKEKFTIVD